MPAAKRRSLDKENPKHHLSLQRQIKVVFRHNWDMSVTEPQPLPPLAWPGRARRIGVQTEDILSALANRVGDLGVTSKAELVRLTQLPRSTVGGHIDWLLQRGVLSRSPSRGALRRGRPAELVSLNPRAGTVFAVEMGVRHTTAAIIDLGGVILARRRIRLATSGDPKPTLAKLTAVVQDLVAQGTSLEPEAVSWPTWWQWSHSRRGSTTALKPPFGQRSFRPGMGSTSPQR